MTITQLLVCVYGAASGLDHALYTAHHLLKKSSADFKVESTPENKNKFVFFCQFPKLESKFH